MPNAVGTRAQFVEEIRTAEKRCIEGILSIGRTLTRAKQALPHGEFTKMIEHDLPFDASTAQRLMKIARDPRLEKAARVQLLPSAWSTLTELTKLPDAAFEQALASGAINPCMTRAQAKNVRMKLTRRDTMPAAPNTAVEGDKSTVVSPIDNCADAEKQQDPPPPDRASQTLSKIERLVCDLEKIVEQGDVRRDAIFDARLRALHDRIRSLIVDDAPSRSR